MPLPAPSLDDRRFQDLVDEAKRAIPRHCPEWTNHNLNDPGVALIELFAWMQEQLLYRLNQVPDRLYLHFLDLVGVRPFAPAAASCDVTFWLTAPLVQPYTVPAGTQVATVPGQGPGVVFSTADDLLLTPPRLVHVFTATAAADDVLDVTDLVLRGTPVPCFRTEPPTPGDTVLLGFAGSLASQVLRLGVQARAEGIGIDPLDPPLQWQVWTGAGWEPVPVHRDTTGGLNRDGEVVLLLPPRHRAHAVAGVSAHWLRVVLRATAPDRPGYRRAPLLAGLEAAAVGGTARAWHAEAVPGEQLGRGDGRPGQTFTVQRTPVLARRPGEHVVVQGPGGDEPWVEVADFAASGPDDRHYVWDGASGEVRFGPAVRRADGSVHRHGAAPPDGARVAVTGYRTGGGAAGCVGPRTLVVQRTPLPQVATVTNLQGATGGVDAETVAEVAVRGPLALRTGMRAVTARDHERLALQADRRVARARCAPPDAAAGPVRLLLVPRLGVPDAPRDLDDLALAPDLVQVLARALEPRRVVGTRLELTTPYYQGVSVAALVRCAPTREPGVVRAAADLALTRHLDPVTGGPRGAGWPFGTDLAAAALAQLLEGVDGVAAVDEVVLFEYDLRRGVRTGPGRDTVGLDPDSLFLPAAPAVVVR